MALLLFSFTLLIPFSFSLTAPLYRVDSLTSPEQLPRSDSLSFNAVPTLGEYYTRVTVGTPSRDVNLVIDTGSDLTWLKRCSPTFRPISCVSRSTTCRGQGLTCRVTNANCMYTQSYGDGSWTEGDLSSGAFTLGGKLFKGFKLGCSLDEKDMENIDGLLGLGRGKLSFPSQTMAQLGGVFSHCLSDKEDHSTVDFGVVPGDTLFTPMMDHPSNYYVELTGISVGGTLVSGVDASLFATSDPEGIGGVIIDSGTTYTTLVETAYIKVRDAFLDASEGLELASVPESEHLQTCFTAKKTPGMVLHFRGADVELAPESCVVPGKGQGRWCLAFKQRSGASVSIIGNTQLQRMRVVYDLARSRLGFAPNAC